MPEIKFTQAELDKRRTKSGIYASLRPTNNQGMVSLKVALISIIEASFREYARAHNANAEMENREWQRYKKYLLKYL